MSGICLVYGPENAAVCAESMVRTMAAYGQQSGVAAAAPSIAFGRAWHGRLPHEHMPEIDCDAIIVLVEGEIYDDRGVVPEPEALIRDLYETGRIDQCAWLNGTFAAIICDIPQKKVHLVSDRVGSRPLFVYNGKNHLAVASRLDALLSDTRIPRKLSLQGLTELISFQRTVADHTQYQEIGALPAAALWTVSAGALSKRQVRRLAWRNPEVGKAEMAEQLAEALKGAARRRTSDTENCGLLLSGGLDARWVLAAARACGVLPSCITAGPEDNFEVDVARRTAAMAGAPFEFMHNPPLSLSSTLDAATTASHGLFAAPINLFGLLPSMAKQHDVLLSGHGLDYTLRGYYLPCVMLRIGHSATRLPRLRKIPDGSPKTVANSLRIAIGQQSLEQILVPAVRKEWDERRYAAMAAALAHADIENPYNAWDTFILHCLGRHYAWSDFAAMNNVVEHRALTFDPDVLDIYFSMPPEWRAQGTVAQQAMILLAPDLMELPDANSGFPGRVGFMTQVFLLYGRAILRRLGLRARPKPGDQNAGIGSWANYGALFQNDEIFKKRLESLGRSENLLDTGIFDPQGLARLAEDYLSGRVREIKLMHQLLTIESWLRAHSYTGLSS